MRVRSAFLAGLFALAVAAPAQAATFTVNTTADSAAPAGCPTTCSLRAAISAAAGNGNTADDTIVIPAGTYTLNAQLGGLVVPSSATRITLQGAGANTTAVEAPVGSTLRVLTISTSASVALERLTLRNGNVTTVGGVGGNLWVQGQATATLTGVRITGGRAPQGGGIAAAGATALTIARSVIDANVATGTNLTEIGGGIYVQGQTSATATTITDSTITGNTARNGGGIGVVNNTGQPPALRGVTLARNNARAGTGIGVGGIYSQNTNARFQGSIVAGNTTTVNGGSGPIVSPANCALASAATDEGGNLESDAQCGFASQNTNPQLATSLDTAAEPPVLSIPANSPAVDIAACGGRTLDQRGLSRPQGATCDAGAYEVDTAATMTITSGPTGAVTTRDVQFGFSANQPGVAPACRLAGPGQSNTFAACSQATSHPYTGLADGAYTFSVRDGAFAGAPVVSRSFTVDATAPNTMIVTGPTGSVSSTSATFTYTSTETGSTFQCALDGAAFGACPAGYTGLAQGAHTFQVRATDAVGNVDGSPAIRNWTVDTVAPNTALTLITTPTSDQTPTFTFASNEAGAAFQCRVDAVAFATCTTPHTTAALGDGPHTFEVRAVDAAGNIDGSPASQPFVVDAGVPDTTIESGPSGAINDATPTFTFSSNEAGAVFSCSFDGAEPVPCASPLTPAALAEGAHTFTVRARDASGNVDASPATRAFTVDVTPPAAPEVVSGPGGPTTDPAPAFAFAATDTVTCRLEGPVTRDFETCASPKSFGALPPGDYVFVVRSVDAAGNANETRRAFSVTVPQAGQPTPTPSPTPTPTPSATRVVVAPAAGTISVRLPGARTFGPLDVSKDIPFGSEVDTRKGRVTLTALPTAGKPPETADFYDGLFTVHKVGGFIELRLSEKLTGCPKARKSTASTAQKKPKSRKLWGSGKGKFRTRGQYSAATVRGTTWLVQDTCTTTLTRVTQGVVAVNDFAKRKTLLVKKGKRYTARPKRR